MLDTYEITLVLKGTMTAESPVDALDRAKGAVMADGRSSLRLEEVKVTRA